jgi:ABC-2 type transport system ATP-binding protein
MEKRAGELSRGQRQRLAIGQTIVHEPKALLLDEPAAGLDPEARRGLSDLITALAGEGMTLLVSSHILAELEDYATEMLMLKDGRVAAGGPVRVGERTAAEGGRRMRAHFAAAPDDLGWRLASLGFQVEAAAGDEATIVLKPGEDAEAEALSALIGAGLRVRSFAPARSSLEDAYLQEARRGPPSASDGGRIR